MASVRIVACTCGCKRGQVDELVQGWGAQEGADARGGGGMATWRASVDTRQCELLASASEAKFLEGVAAANAGCEHPPSDET
eukprot:15460325-Alexandrium_andersonii.AAC.1